MGYTKTAIKGFSWLTLFRVITRAVSFVKAIILARFITPSQFGVFGIVMLVLSFIEVITETGVNVFLVQEKEGIDRYLSTAWIVSILRGTIIALGMIISSPFVAGFFNTPEAQILIVIASLIPFLRGFINPAVVKFQKELRFKNESIYRTILLLIEITSTIILLYFYPQTISLILGILVGVVAEVIISFTFIKPRPRLEFNKEYLNLVVHQGKWVTGTVILNYIYERGDNITVGRMINAHALGIYDMGYRFAMLPVTEIAEMLGRVIFPVYVNISEDYERFKKAFLRTLGATALLVVPIGCLFFFFPREIVHLVLGDKWIEVVPVLQVLSVLGVVKAIMNVAHYMLLSVKMQKQITYITLVGVFGMFSTIIPLVQHFGILGAAYAATSGYLLTVPFVVYFCMKALNSIKHKKSSIIKK
jgi:lipopolysaccharide exporter